MRILSSMNSSKVYFLSEEYCALTSLGSKIDSTTFSGIFFWYFQVLNFGSSITIGSGVSSTKGSSVTDS